MEIVIQDGKTVVQDGDRWNRIGIEVVALNGPRKTEEDNDKFAHKTF